MRFRLAQANGQPINNYNGDIHDVPVLPSVGDIVQTKDAQRFKVVERAWELQNDAALVILKVEPAS